MIDMIQEIYTFIDAEIEQIAATILFVSLCTEK